MISRDLSLMCSGGGTLLNSGITGQIGSLWGESALAMSVAESTVQKRGYGLSNWRRHCETTIGETEPHRLCSAPLVRCASLQWPSAQNH